MASRIVRESCNTYENAYSIEVNFTSYLDYSRTKDFVKKLNDYEKEPTPPKCVSAESKILQKPLACRNAHCGAMCSPADAEFFRSNPSKCCNYEQREDLYMVKSIPLDKVKKAFEEIKQGKTSGIPNADREAMELPPKKPQGMLLAKSNDTMLDVARNVIKAVETTIEDPTGLRSLTVNKNEETKDRIQELIGYLKNYVEWR